MTEIDVPVIGGPWLPAKDFFEKVQGAINNSHGHENKNVLDNITDEVFADVGEAIENKHTHENKNVLDNITDEVFADVGEAIENKHIHENKEYLDTLSERPTATLTLNSLEGYAQADVPSMGCFTIIDYNDMLTDNDIADGTEIKKIEVSLTGEENDWVNINEMYTVDNIPYHISMSKVFKNNENHKVFAVAAQLFIAENYIWHALSLYDPVYFRITYYTD